MTYEQYKQYMAGRIMDMSKFLPGDLTGKYKDGDTLYVNFELNDNWESLYEVTASFQLGEGNYIKKVGKIEAYEITGEDAVRSERKRVRDKGPIYRAIVNAARNATMGFK